MTVVYTRIVYQSQCESFPTRFKIACRPEGEVEGVEKGRKGERERERGRGREKDVYQCGMHAKEQMHKQNHDR